MKATNASGINRAGSWVTASVVLALSFSGGASARMGKGWDL